MAPDYMGLYGPIWAYMGLYGRLRASMDVSAGRSVQAETNMISFIRGKNTGSSTRKLLERGRKEITCPEPRTRASREFLQLRLSNVQLTTQEAIYNDIAKIHKRSSYPYAGCLPFLVVLHPLTVKGAEEEKHASYIVANY